jgi:GMP synthase-like glutamine amidotransferase
LRKLAIFNYKSLYLEDIKRTVQQYNLANSKKAFQVEVYDAKELLSESHAGLVDAIIHTGGDGSVVKEDMSEIPKLYICYSHQWKARKEGGEVSKLKTFRKGIYPIDILEDDRVLGKKGKMSIMQRHEFIVSKPPRGAKVLAASRIKEADGSEIEVVESLRYPNGSISIQGHPEEGTAAHIFYNFFDMIKE